MTEILWFLILLAAGYVFGTRNERQHFQSIAEREARYKSVPLISTDEGYDADAVASVKLVDGNVSVGPDYFRIVVASVLNFFGGRIGVYENLLDRARREAILRMLEKSGDCDLVVNLRLETFVVDAGVSRKKRWITSIDALAYGTALKLKSKSA